MSPVPRGPRSVLRVAFVIGLSLVPILVAAGLSDRPAPTAVLVGGKLALLPHRATLKDAIRAFDLHPMPGRLLDVNGAVLERRAVPGAILVDGHPAEPRAALSNGDRIRVVDGTDRTEGTMTVRMMLPGRGPGDPMYTLATSKVLEIRTVGRVSGEVASIRYQAAGPIHRPAEVALTFDDGPWPSQTRAFVRVLRKMHVHATFFMVGYLVERYPGIVQDVIHAGMAIGDHSWSHPYQTPFRDLTPHRIQTEIDRPAQLLEERFGVRPQLFRTPGGAFDQDVVDTAREAGMRVVQWSVDPKDYEPGATAKGIARYVLAHVGPGSIVLMHDGGGDRSATLKALPKIVRGIRRMGLRLVAIQAPLTR